MSVGFPQAMVYLPCFYGFNPFAVWPAPQSVSGIIFYIKFQNRVLCVECDADIIECSYFVR